MEQWLHGPIQRHDAEYILHNHGWVNGLYLVRQKITDTHGYVLSTIQEGKALHFMIEKTTGVFIVNGQQFGDYINLVELIEFMQQPRPHFNWPYRLKLPVSAADADQLDHPNPMDPSRYLMLWDNANGGGGGVVVPPAGAPMMRRTTSLGAYSAVNMTAGGYTLAQSIDDDDGGPYERSRPRTNYNAGRSYSSTGDQYGESHGQFYDIGQSQGADEPYREIDPEALRKWTASSSSKPKESPYDKPYHERMPTAPPRSMSVSQPGSYVHYPGLSPQPQRAHPPTNNGPPSTTSPTSPPATSPTTTTTTTTTTTPSTTTMPNESRARTNSLKSLFFGKSKKVVAQAGTKCAILGANKTADVAGRASAQNAILQLSFEKAAPKGEIRVSGSGCTIVAADGKTVLHRILISSISYLCTDRGDPTLMCIIADRVTDDYELHESWCYVVQIVDATNNVVAQVRQMLEAASCPLLDDGFGAFFANVRAIELQHQMTARPAAVLPQSQSGGSSDGYLHPVIGPPVIGAPPSKGRS